MTDKEMITKFKLIQAHLWGVARKGNMLQSAFCAALIRALHIESPEGDAPGSA